MIIEGSKVIEYMYDTEHEQFVGKNWDKAADKFAKWIMKNTSYRGIIMYIKHVGCHKFYITENGNRYEYSGGALYRVDEHYNLYAVDQSLVKGE